MLFIQIQSFEIFLKVSTSSAKYLSIQNGQHFAKIKTSDLEKLSICVLLTLLSNTFANVSSTRKVHWPIEGDKRKKRKNRKYAKYPLTLLVVSNSKKSGNDADQRTLDKNVITLRKPSRQIASAKNTNEEEARKQKKGKVFDRRKMKEPKKEKKHKSKDIAKSRDSTRKETNKEKTVKAVEHSEKKPTLYSAEHFHSLASSSGKSGDERQKQKQDKVYDSSKTSLPERKEKERKEKQKEKKAKKEKKHKSKDIAKSRDSTRKETNKEKTVKAVEHSEKKPTLYSAEHFHSLASSSGKSGDERQKQKQDKVYDSSKTSLPERKEKERKEKQKEKKAKKEKKHKSKDIAKSRDSTRKETNKEKTVKAVEHSEKKPTLYSAEHFHSLASSSGKSGDERQKQKQDKVYDSSKTSLPERKEKERKEKQKEKKAKKEKKHKSKDIAKSRDSTRKETNKEKTVKAVEHSEKKPTLYSAEHFHSLASSSGKSGDERQKQKQDKVYDSSKTSLPERKEKERKEKQKEKKAKKEKKHKSKDIAKSRDSTRKETNKEKTVKAVEHSEKKPTLYSAEHFHSLASSSGKSGDERQKQKQDKVYNVPKASLTEMKTKEGKEKQKAKKHSTIAKSHESEKERKKEKIATAAHDSEKKKRKTHFGSDSADHSWPKMIGPEVEKHQKNKSSKTLLKKINKDTLAGEFRSAERSTKPDHVTGSHQKKMMNSEKAVEKAQHLPYKTPDANSMGTCASEELTRKDEMLLLSTEKKRKEEKQKRKIKEAKEEKKLEKKKWLKSMESDKEEETVKNHGLEKTSVTCKEFQKKEKKRKISSGTKSMENLCSKMSSSEEMKQKKKELETIGAEQKTSLFDQMLDIVTSLKRYRLNQKRKVAFDWIISHPYEVEQCTSRTVYYLYTAVGDLQMNKTLLQRVLRALREPVGDAITADEYRHSFIVLESLPRKQTITISQLAYLMKLHDHTAKCVPINIPLCRGLQYNQTMYPNLLKHPSQEEAATEIKQYEMLVNVQCSQDFKFFLCTMFAPVCTMLPFPIPPCKHLCQSAKLGCDNLMQKFGYSWPEIFNCDQFPEFGTKDAICVGENRTDTEASTKTAVSSIDKSASNVRSHFECPHTMKVLGRTRNTLLIANTTIDQCSLPCQNDGIVPTFFNAQTRHYLKLWTGAWAVVCCICMLFTIVTFLIDLERFEFPERAILYMSLCYFVVSATYMVGLVAEDNLSCSGMSATKTQLVTQGIDNFACTATAVAHYFFTTAGIIWWVILCFSWFLVTTLKWGEAPVEQVFLSYFNIIAWFLPALMVIAILVTNSVDGDVFTGICSVGNLQPSVLFNFVVVPQAILIAIGLLLFACGFVSILRILSYIRGQQLSKFESANGAAATEKVRTLMCRISSFTIFYIVPLIIGELCTYYQAVNMENWLTSWYSTRCLHAQRGAFGFTQSREFCPIYSERSGGMTLSVSGNHETPEPVLFFIKYLSYFTVGIACAIWTVNGKTFSSYGDFYVKLFYGRSRVPTRVH